jgi:putative membrane protein
MTLASIPALGQKKTAEKTGMSDQQFVDFAGQTDMIEANLGQLAQDVAASQSVKDYGKMLANDHTGDYNQLSGIAMQANLNMPKSIDAKHVTSMIAPFHKLSGASFDHRFIAEMIAGHTKAIAIYKKEAAGASNQAIQSYAEQTLPVLEKHLDDAKKLDKEK